MSPQSASLFNRPVVQRFSVALCLILALCVQFRVQLNSGFAVLYGDSYDATIVVTILEHWFNVFRGLSHWSQVSYFFPHTNTLGQTDGYFLTGILYAPIRALGVDPYLSSELANLLLRGIGFIAFYCMAVRMFGFKHYWALLGAVLFILSNNLTVHGQRLQLATVSVAPPMALLLWHTFEAFRDGHRRRMLAAGAAAGVLLGAWSITCFYITWFFIYFTVFLVVISVASCGASHRQWLWRNIKAHRWVLLAIAAVTAVSLLPLLSVYLPKAAETGMRPYESALSNTVALQGIVQVGNENFLFGGVYNRLLTFISPGYAPSSEYYNTGIAPLVFFFFACGSLYTYRERLAFKQASVWFPLALATLVTWVGVINVGGHSAWYFLYHGFPGAKALNIVSAYQIFLSVPVILLALRYLQSVDHRTPKALVLVIVGLLCLEELNQGYTQLNRSAELAKVALGERPPAACRTFYVSGWPDQDHVSGMPAWINNYYAHNVSAMLIAEQVHVPTVNGMASFNPKDWNFANPNSADYEQRIRAYTDSYGLTGVCRLDLATKVWSLAW